MKQLLITIAAVVLVGCGESQYSAPAPEAKPIERVAGAKAPVISIHDAAGGGNIEAVKQHLATGTDVNAKNENSQTPLHSAADKGHKEIVELLITKSADVNPISYGMTPLDYAAHQANPNASAEIADLLRKQAEKSKSHNSKVPHISVHEGLHEAIFDGNIEAVKQHLAAGADVNVKDDKGRTPLHGAAAGGHKEIVELLITKGADLNPKVNQMTPLDMATLPDNPNDTAATAALLRKHGGKTKKELEAEGK